MRDPSISRLSEQAGIEKAVKGQGKAVKARESSGS